MDDTKIKKVCPNCNQLYFIRSVAPKVSNIPLFLSCGHSMCESCITNMVKFQEPIECKICQRDTTLAKTELTLINEKKKKIYEFFPVNYSMLGELIFQLDQISNQNQESNHYVDLKTIMAHTESSCGKCLECHNQTSKMCQQCATALCDTCFNKSHKNFIIFKNHALINIDQVLLPNDCKTHKGKPLDYYCKDCKKSICMDCLMVGGEKSCKNHDVVSMTEVNDNFLEEIIDITPKVDETFRRLTKTAVDVGHLLNNIENDTGSSSELTSILGDVEQHFSKIMAAIQKHEHEVVNIIIKLKCSEKESLLKAKEVLEKYLKRAKKVLNTINAFSNPKKVKQYNLSVLLDEAKQILEAPWYLSRDESNDPLKVAVNEDLCTLVSDYIHLEGNANSVYKLCPTSALGEGVEMPPAPSAPVFPPELPRDVRVVKEEKRPAKANLTPMYCKKVPSYHSKCGGSMSSLNSAHSDTSDKGGTFSVYGENSQRPVVQPVQPFTESQHPKQLHEGSQELIYITHIVDPHNFFVQRACHQSLVKEMQREFRNAASLPKPSLSHVAEGKTYLMFNKADNMWQRCRVVSINRKDLNTPTFLVFCIDFGSTETVSIDKLRLLPPARVQSPYPLATNCALANCEPNGGYWSPDDAYLIQSIVDNKQAIIHVRAIRSTSVYSVRLEVDVTTFEEGVSLAHALLFHERARMPNPRLPPKILGTMQRPKIFMGNNDLKPKSIEEVYITCIISPDKFYVTKRHVKDVYEKLCEDLEQEYSLQSNVGLVYQPEVGMSVVAYVEGCRGLAAGWARGVVQALPGRSRVSLLLPDTGHLLYLHWTKLRHIRQEFTITRALASECHLAGVTPLNKKWSAGSVALLQRYEEKLLELHVDDVRRASAGVTLYDNTEPDNIVCINTEMIKHKYAVSFGLYKFNKDNDLEKQSSTVPLERPPATSRRPGQIQLLKKKTTKVHDEELDAKDKGPLRLEAKVLHYQSPSLIYVSLVHQQKAFNDLYEQIQKHYLEKKTAGKEQWAVGDKCVTLCASSRTYRRAAVLELVDDKAKVFYSDFACVESVPTASLMELVPEFSGYGDAAIQCHLCGIVPADGSDEWPTLTKEYLKELLDVYPRIFITKLGNFKNKSMPVEIWVYHTIQGGALEPNKSEWRCLNKKIIEQGLGIPDKSQQMSTSTESSPDDMLSFLKNVTGSVEEFLLLEPLPTKPLAAALSPAKSAHSLDEEERPAEAEPADTLFISDWLPPEPLTSDEFTAMPTYIDNDGVIYLHDVKQQDTLDLIRKALDVRFKKPDPRAKFHKWSVGEPCIALFFLDSKYYRGRVVEVNADTASCLINYVDYGNEELCSFENLRKSVALYQIPVQATRCVLARVRPVGGRWDRATLDYIHKSIVEKNCFVKLAGEPQGGLVPIDLKYDKLWINDHLVDFEMAEYTDGSRPVVPVVRVCADPAPRPAPCADHDSSGPDYIVEDDSASQSQASFKSLDLDGRDWNEVIELEQQSAGRFLRFPAPELPAEFRCTVPVINSVRLLELSVVRDEQAALSYAQLSAAVQCAAAAAPPLDGAFEDKACLALFPEDGLWYRAAVLQLGETEGRVKVRYVDYGNMEVVPLSAVRELPAELLSPPPGAVRARLAAGEVSPAADVHTVAREYERLFIDKGPFRAKLVGVEDSVPVVELYDDDDELVYKELIESGIFVPAGE